MQTEKLSRGGGWRVSESPSFARKWWKLLADGEQLGYERQYLILISKKIYVAAGTLVQKSEIRIERHNHKDSLVSMIAASFLEEQPKESLAKMLQQAE